MPVMVLLFDFLLLYTVAALPAGSQPPLPPSSLESQPPILSPVSCWKLMPESLPNFNRLDPLPRYLISLSLYISLEQAGCPTDARALRQQLYRLGGVEATETLIQQLHGLQEGSRERKSDWVLFSILQLLGSAERLGRAPRSLSLADCVYEKEQRVYNVMRFLPQVGSFYNLGTAFYYAAQNCTAQAWDRGQEAAVDLGYDFLLGLMGTTGGPAGLIASLALKPVVKSGIQRLIEYYSNKEGSGSPPPGTDQSWQKDWRTTTEIGNS
ncbi:apolipoprotein F [Vombatus ursinus]|uniref:apolipoprotein F n=1 Tax=Vombatus ursinus TaxID=29139 RepID=UPI000FFD9D97|nr:apolipoprotein F [Vombatus ursinus]